MIVATCDGPRPSLEQFVKHAQRFGTECLFLTAEEYLTEAQLVRLRIELDVIERERKSASGYSIGTRRRRPQAETKAAVLALREEGKLPAVIADKLGVTDAYVEQILRAA